MACQNVGCASSPLLNLLKKEPTHLCDLKDSCILDVKLSYRESESTETQTNTLLEWIILWNLLTIIEQQEALSTI